MIPPAIPCSGRPSRTYSGDHQPARQPAGGGQPGQPAAVTTGFPTDPHLPRTRCHTRYTRCMTMLSFRVDDDEAANAQRWAERLGVDRSELLREALRRHLVRLASENDAETWEARPLDEGERALEEIADWGPAEDEDWLEWADATR